MNIVTNTDLGPDKYQVNLGFVICPGAKLHGAVLIVEGEVGDVHGAGRFENGWRNPGDGTVELQQSLGFVLDQEISYSTGSVSHTVNRSTTTAQTIRDMWVFNATGG